MASNEIPKSLSDSIAEIISVHEAANNDRIAELAIEVAARDRVLEKVNEIDDFGTCALCVYRDDCNHDRTRCIEGMIAFAKAEIERGK